MLDADVTRRRGGGTAGVGCVREVRATPKAVAQKVMLRMALFALLIAKSYMYATPVAGAEPTSMLLDGDDWQLELDPTDPVTIRLKAAGNKTKGPVSVPGAWQTQGFGEETAALKNQYIGVATYSKSVAVPKAMTAAGRSLWVVTDRIERSAKLVVGGKLVTEHTGYLSRLEGDVTSLVSPSGSLALELVVNATRNVGFDGLVGCNDIVMDGSIVGGWGGLAGHVRLESRAAAWIVFPHVQHDLVTPREASVNVSIEIGTANAAPPPPLTLRVTYVDPAGKTVGTGGGTCGAKTCNVADQVLEAPALWSPDSPTQYTAHIELLTTQQELLDTVDVKFGIKKLEVVDGSHWKLNGHYQYLFGYGDDSIYPTTMSEPVNHSFYAARINLTRSLGFNFVRHHSHILPIEYFDAACEAGLMVSAEFPLGYGGAAGSCPGDGCDAMLKHEWVSIIKQIRNHPCVFDYTMDNEDINLHFAKDWYATAKALDPARPVNTADGVWGSGKVANPVDFRAAGFALNDIPLGDPHQFALKTTPTEPVIVHEMGNFVIWPLLEDTIARFDSGGMKPYWLTPARDKLSTLGLLGENALWSELSSKLFLFCWKNQVEAVRKTELLSGYEWWLIQDYWMGSNGIMDFFWNPKLSETGMAEVKSINAAVSLLIAEPGDNLPGTDDTNTTSFLRHYVSKDTLQTTVHVSNYGDSDISGSVTLSWQVLGVAANGSNTTICQASSLAVPALPQGPALTKVAAVRCALPDLGTFANNPQTPVTLTLAVQLRDAGGTVISSNSWLSRVYAAYEDGPAPNGARVYTLSKWTNSLPYSNLQIIPADGAVPVGSILVVDTLDAAAIGFASAGSTVIVMHEAGGTGSSSAFGGLQTEPAKFKTAWWLGSSTDNNMGTIVYHDLWQGVFAGMAPDGWADEGWFRLIEGGVNYILDAVSGSVEVLVRSIDLMASSHNKALIWQTGLVGSNSSSSSETGTLIVTGLQLVVNDFAPGGEIQVPEAAWAVHSIISTAAKAPPKPKTALQLKLTNCPGCLPPVNANLCPVGNTTALERHTALVAAEQRLAAAASEVAELKLLLGK